MEAILYPAMVAAALVVELLFRSFGGILAHRQAVLADTAIHFNHTAMLNIVFGAVFAILAFVFFRTGGPDMLRIMNGNHRAAPSSGHDMSEWDSH